jgi:hypothetical protein
LIRWTARERDDHTSPSDCCRAARHRTQAHELRSDVADQGLEAARATWTGDAEGMQWRGVMYCVIVGTKIVSLHVQDLAASPPRSLREADAAVASIRFKGGK